MSYVVVDGFAGTNGANLTARAGILGATWAKVAGASADILLSIANRARGNANALARYVASGIPETANYDVTAIIRRMDGRGEAGVMARASATADTGYVLSYVHSAGQWQLRRVVAGAATTLGTFAQTFADGQDVMARLKVRGTGATVTLRALLDGTERIAAQDSNGNRIVTAGRVGLRINAATGTLNNTRSYHVARIVAFALPDDLRPQAPKPGDGPLALRILAAVAAERPRVRATILQEAFAAHGGPLEWQVARGATTYNLTVGTVTVRPQDGALVVPVVTCVPPPPVPLDSGGYVFVNPPIRVTDGAVHEEEDSQGESSFVANFQENALEALRQIVADVVLRGA